MWEARLVGRKEEEPTSAAIPALQEETQCEYNLHKERHTPNMSYTLLEGSNLDLLPTLPDCSVDAIVTDPPYELGFMGKSWDASGIAYSVDLWRECLRVLKHGGHLLAFGGSRTYHRLACAVEDAGFEIRDQIMWVYGSGFPKSMDISKAIDKAAGAEREVKKVPPRPTTSGTMLGSSDTRPWIERSRELGYHEVAGDTAITDEAKQWSGWGTALKPAHEPIVVARKPLDGTVANNVLKHGVGGFNIDACRVPHLSEADRASATPQGRVTSNRNAGAAPDVENDGRHDVPRPDTSLGRFPANFIHDGSEEVTALFPDTKSGTAIRNKSGGNTFGGNNPKPPLDDLGYNDQGSAARFFYCAKASKAERNAGLDIDQFPLRHYTNANKMGGENDTMLTGSGNPRDSRKQNFHPTVKPIALMRYLIRLVTPPNGTVLDPFAGSGTTLVAAIQEGMQPIGIELTEDYWQIIHARCEHATSEPIQQTLT